MLWLLAIQPKNYYWWCKLYIGECTVFSWLLTCMRSSNYRAQKSATHLIGTSRFLLSLAQWASYQASHLPTRSLKEQTKTWPELDTENSRGTCPKGKLEFRQVFFEPWNDQTLQVQFFLEKLIVQNSLEGLGIIVRCLKQRRNEP